MIFAYFRPLMVMMVSQGGRGLGAEVPGDGVTSSKLHVDKAGGGGVAVAPTGPVMWQWSCHKVTLPHCCWT